MELVKNFSDETGKGGNPGRFTFHLEQVERSPVVGNIELQTVFERVLHSGSK